MTNKRKRRRVKRIQNGGLFMSKTYIHYGNDHFDEEIFNNKKNNPRDNSFLNKPPYGLWGSPEKGDWTWKDFCEAENYRTSSFDKNFRFALKDDAKIFVVRDRHDCLSYLKDTFLGGKKLDFDRIMDEYDGMELIHGKNYMDLHMEEFYSWDVDSIVIWNPQILQFL